jgi:hypothetical protein
MTGTFGVVALLAAAATVHIQCGAVVTSSDCYSVEGEVWVRMMEGVRADSARSALGYLGLAYSSFERSPLETIVAVPMGAEDEWVDRFRAFAFVDTAGRVTSCPGGED